MYKCRRPHSLPLILSAVLLLLAALPVSASADENACQVEITTLDPEPVISDLLSEVKFRYIIKHSEKCQIHTILDAKDPMVCQKPNVEIRPSELTTQLLTVIDMSCVYRRPGHFYLAPVYFEVQQSDSPVYNETQSPASPKHTIVHPKMPHVTIRENADNADLNSQFQSSLVLLPWKQKQVALWILFIGMAITFCALFFAIYSRILKNKQAEEKYLEFIPPIQEFNSEIALLVDVTPMTLDEYKVYHDRLSYALRLYIAKRFELKILNMTTSQLIRELRNNNIPSDLCETAERLLNASDFVKFALDAPSQADNLLILRDMGTLGEDLEKLAIQREQEQAETNTPAPTPQTDTQEQSNVSKLLSD